ncbi:Gamma-glutamyltranspeptidase 1 [Mactra antiquata]
MAEKMSKGRMWAVVTVILVALIIALGIGLGLALQREIDENEPKVNDTTENEETEECNCPEEKIPSSSRLTDSSPIYVAPTDIKEGFYRYGSVATDAPICSSYGTEMMLRGGSTMDAAITAILCNGVYNPQSCGIGGGFFMTYYKRSSKEKYAVMAREMAPGNATEDMFVDEAVSSREGGMAIAIPGEIKGLYKAWELGGRLPWEVLFRPSIQLCEEGFTVGQLLHNDIQNNMEYINRNDELKSMLTNPATGQLVVKGDKLKLRKLGATMRKIAEDPNSFYNGTLAEDIVKDIEDAGGIITLRDLDAYTASVKDPLSIQLSTGNYTVFSPPPPSSGAVLLLMLNILDGFGMTADDLSNGAKSVETFHRITEAFKHGFSVRTKLGDVDQEDQAFKDEIAELVNNMTSLDWGKMKRAKILQNTQNTSYYEPVFNFTIPDAGTSHISVYGRDGDAVSITSTINLYFGSKVVGSRTGIVFNNEMDDFSTPGTVNYFQVPASPANYIKPYKRPLSSMSPSVVVDSDGDVKLVTGSSGGTRIITSNALSIIHTLWLELGLKEAIEYPRIHHQLLPEELRIESAMPKVIKDGLLARGHKFDVREKLGSAIQAVLTRNKKADSVENMMNHEFTEIYSYSDPVKYGRTDGV